MQHPCSFKTIVAFAALMVLSITSASFGDKEASGQAPVNAAVVNGKPITYADFQRELGLYYARLKSQGGQMPEGAGEIKSELIAEMIIRELIFQESVKKGIKVGPEFIKEEISTLQQRFADRQQFEGWLASMNMSEAQLKEQIYQRQAIRTLIDNEIAPTVKANEADSKAFYQNNPNAFKRPEEVHAQHILIKIEKDADEKQKAEARKSLLELKKRIDAGEDFGQIAKSHSQCPSAPKGGDLGFFTRGRMVPAFEKVAFELKPGGVSDLVETQFGYHLIKVLEHREAKTMGYEEVQAQIAAHLRNLKIRAEVLRYAEKLRKAAKIETFVQ